MKISFHRGLVSTAAMAMSLAFVIPLGQSVNAATVHSRVVTSISKPAGISTTAATAGQVAKHGWNLVPGAAKSLTIREPYRHTGIHIMPPLQWYEKHSVGAGATSPTSLPTPTCTLGSDPSTGDAAWEGQQNDALDITAFGLSTSSDGKNLTAQIKVQSLTDGAGGKPALSGDGDTWYVTWDYGTYPGINGYFLEASYPGGTGNIDSDSGLPVDFQWGEIQAGTAGATSATYAPLGSATGSMDLNSNTITISAPLSAFSSTTSSGGPQAFGLGAALKKVDAETWDQIGAPGVGGLIQPIDKAQTQTGDYVVGDAYPNCPSAATTGGGTVVGGGQSAAPSQGSSNNLSYFGGPIVHKIHNYVIFWLPQAGTTTGPDGNSCPLPATASYNYEPSTPTNTYGSGSDWNYEQILEQYFRDLQGSSFYNLLGQYADRSTGAINNVESLGGVWSDPCGYTSTPTPAATALPGGTAANPVYDYDIQQEVLRAIKINHWPEGLGNQYYVYLGFSAATCFNPSTSNPSGAACDISGVPPAFCAYHGDFTDPNNGNTVLYANMTDGGLETAYACYSAPIGSGTSPAHTVPVQGGKPGQTTQVHDFVADAEVSITSHEQFETDTDSMVGTAAAYAPPLGWYDEANGEIGDKCAYTYGNVAPDGSNISLQNGDHYIVQQEYSNWANGCSLGDSHVAAQPFGGASTSIPVYSGWNLLGLPTSGLGSADALANDMQRKGQLPSGSVQALVTFRNGIWNATVPGYTADQPLTRTEGIYLLSGSSGSYAPTGQPYTSPASLTFQSGWNLVAPTWPNPGLTTDAMFNQIEAENRACQADAFTNGACNPTVSAIDTYGPSYDSKGNVDGAQFINWSPAAPDQAGNATWPEHQGNQVPFTAGMWVNTDHSLSWTPQGTECQQIASGMCR